MVNPPPFELAPGQVNASVFVDYTLITGIKLFKLATAKTPETFGGDYKWINLFNDKLLEKAKKSGWKNTGSNIAMIDDTNRNPMNIISEY